MVAEPAKFVTSASLWPPEFVSRRSAWNGHIPVAGWIVEATLPRVFVELGTYTGVSYFAFCEAVARLETGTRCFAVDTWVGDEHAGFYGEEVFEAADARNAALYGSFSRLLRTTFDGAVGEFADGSIDLLHIDGYHAYEAVRHDFETWPPKLSDRGIVLLHDTNEDRPGFGVRRFFAEVAARHPTFEFLHEHGLGIVVVGADPPGVLRDLIEADAGTQAWVRGVYEALGRAARSEVRSQALGKRLRHRDRALTRAQRRVRAIEGSTSWRLTKPLRWVAARISARGFRGRDNDSRDSVR